MFTDGPHITCFFVFEPDFAIMLNVSTERALQKTAEFSGFALRCEFRNVFPDLPELDEVMV